jgi:hypothetical protein
VTRRSTAGARRSTASVAHQLFLVQKVAFFTSRFLAHTQGANDARGNGVVG